MTIVCNEGFVQTLYLDEASTGKKGPLIPELTYLSRMGMFFSFEFFNKSYCCSLTGLFFISQRAYV